jgi:hypothetical protein
MISQKTASLTRNNVLNVNPAAITSQWLKWEKASTAITLLRRYSFILKELVTGK